MVMKIGKFNISNENLPRVIAEMSGNHNQSLDRAYKIVQAAADAGAHALKLQTYTADTMTIKSKKKYFKINNGLWKGYSLCNEIRHFLGAGQHD